MLSHLSTMFRLVGRCGPWNPLTNEGNPIESEIINSHRAAYHASMLKRGYQKGSAIPISMDDHRALVSALDQELAAPDSPVKRLDLCCTALACCYLWEGGQRGKKVGRLELQDLTLPGGESASPALLLGHHPPAELVILPAGPRPSGVEVKPLWFSRLCLLSLPSSALCGGCVSTCWALWPCTSPSSNSCLGPSVRGLDASWRRLCLAVSP